MAEQRIAVDLGWLSRPTAVRWAVEQLPDLGVRTAILGYLEDPGILLGRDWPPGWFFWLDGDKRVFVARCGEPPAVDPPFRDKPWNFFVQAELPEGWPKRRRARPAKAQAFYHESELLP